MMSTSGPHPSFKSDLRERIQRRLEKYKIPGAVIAQVRPHGLDALDAFGVGDVAAGRAVEAHTRFHLYSGTKLFTACSVMQLVERGKLRLEDDVRDWFPDIPIPHAVTVEQVASHSSGFPDTLRAFLAVHFLGESRPSTADALVRYNLTKCRPPGGRASYRNSNYALLGELITKASGDAYEEFVAGQLLAPWNSRANFSVGGESQDAVGYEGRFSLMRLLARPLLGRHGARVFDAPVGRFVCLRPFNLDTAAIGGLVGSASDFAPLVSEFLSKDDGVLRFSTRERMLTRVSTGAAGIASKIGVGIGWKLGEVDGVPFWNHEGGGPGFCTELRVYPRENVGFVILMNRSHSRRRSWLCHDLCELLRQNGRTS